MTSQKIMDLKRRGAYHDEVLRLIDERDVLLKAAQGAHLLLKEGSKDIVEACSALAAAISHAEEP